MTHHRADKQRYSDRDSMPKPSSSLNQKRGEAGEKKWCGITELENVETTERLVA